LQEGDFVLAKTEIRGKKDCYIPGTVALRTRKTPVSCKVFFLLFLSVCIGIIFAESEFAKVSREAWCFSKFASTTTVNLF